MAPDEGVPFTCGEDYAVARVSTDGIREAGKTPEEFVSGPNGWDVELSRKETELLIEILTVGLGGCACPRCDKRRAVAAKLRARMEQRGWTRRAPKPVRVPPFDYIEPLNGE